MRQLAHDVQLRRVASLVALSLVAGCHAPSDDAPRTRAERVDGQWVWSTADAARWRESRARFGDLVPGVWVATISLAHDSVVQRLARAPHVGTATPIAAVVRFDDAFHGAWDAMPDSVIARTVGARLGALLATLDASAIPIREIQLDYDCPERRLGRWAAVVRALGSGPLAGRPLWITSIPVHARHDDYGDLFRGAVAGHVMQVFDTGDRPTQAALDALAADLERHRLPFRLGVGAFERTTALGTTRHRGWFAAARRLARSEWYRGTWVFPAGRRWTPYLATTTGAGR